LGEIKAKTAADRQGSASPGLKPGMYWLRSPNFAHRPGREKPAIETAALAFSATWKCWRSDRGVSLKHERQATQRDAMVGSSALA